jgi:hypothetical protein
MAARIEPTAYLRIKYRQDSGATGEWFSGLDGLISRNSFVGFGFSNCRVLNVKALILIRTLIVKEVPGR